MKTTKKWNKMFLVGILGMALNGIVLTGCVTIPQEAIEAIVYDPEIPQQEQSMIALDASVYFTSFDGNEVRWTKPNDVFIPSGSHTLVYNYSSGNRNAHGLKITYDFKPGYAYWVDVNIVGNWASPGIKEIGMLPWKSPPVSNGSEIVIRRKSAFVGSAINVKIIVDGTLMGQVGNGREIQFVVSNGQHTIHTEDNGESHNEINFLADNQRIVFTVGFSSLFKEFNNTTIVKTEESELSKGESIVD